MALEDMGADEVAGGAMAEPRGGGNEAGVAWRRECEAELGFAGCGLGLALARPALDQRYRSAQQGRKGLLWLMRCRS
jgi:hypothetical protein